MRGRPGLGPDKINILLQTSIGVLRIEGASLDPPYISILEPRKASDLNACYREGTVADKSMFSLSDLNSTGSIYPPEGLKLKKMKLMFFDTPPLQNHCFWAPMEARMEPK